MNESLVPTPVVGPTTVAGPLSGNPDEVVLRATEIAKRLRSIVEEQKLSVRIGQKNHVMVEGWTTMCAMLGVFPRTDWTKAMDSPAGAWEARVTLVHFLTGREIASGEAMCSPEEKRWASAEAYAIRSMSQTRATAKAARLGFSWIVTLAGYDATPAEEMSGVSPEPPKFIPRPIPKPVPAKEEVPPSEGGITPSEAAFLSVAKRIGAATTSDEVFLVKPDEGESARLSAKHLADLRNMVRAKSANLLAAARK